MVIERMFDVNEEIVPVGADPVVGMRAFVIASSHGFHASEASTMTAREQLQAWGSDSDMHLFVSTSFGGTSPTIFRTNGPDMLSRIETIEIDDANQLALKNVDGICFVSIVGSISGLTYRAVVSPIDQFSAIR